MVEAMNDLGDRTELHVRGGSHKFKAPVFYAPK